MGRYLTVVTPETEGKLLTHAEAQGLSAAGIGIVSTFEYQGIEALGGYQQGKEYAALAHEQHTAAGAPAGRPIYLGQASFPADRRRSSLSSRWPVVR